MHDDYETGYGKPPKASQFQKGQSGNPKGRPKGSRNTASIVDSVIHERIQVKEGGRVRYMTKLEASVQQLANQAAAGDLRAIKQFHTLVRCMELTERLEETDQAPDQEKSRAVLNRLLQRMQESQTSDTEVNG